jgi:hypothetical protein
MAEHKRKHSAAAALIEEPQRNSGRRHAGPTVTEQKIVGTHRTDAEI